MFGKASWEKGGRDPLVSVTVRTSSYIFGIITVWLETASTSSPPEGYVVKWRIEENYKEPATGVSAISAEKVKKIFGLLTDLRLPALVKSAEGVDGYTIEVSVGNCWSRVVYSWWSLVPIGWEPLGEIAEILLNYVPKNELGIAVNYLSKE